MNEPYDSNAQIENLRQYVNENPLDEDMSDYLREISFPISYGHGSCGYNSLFNYDDGYDY